MFCYQCEQTAKCAGCTVTGVCGKTPEVAALQDLLIHAVKGVGVYAHRAGELGARDVEIDRLVTDALFTTVTNVNFSEQRMQDELARAFDGLRRARALYEEACRTTGRSPEQVNGPTTWQPADDLQGLVKQGEDAGIVNRMRVRGQDVTGLEELLTYGVKGTAAYAHHAAVLGREDEKVYAFFHKALAELANEDHTADDLLPLVLECGKVNLDVMAMLDAVHNETFGHPEPTPVRVTPVKGKAILVSGHDLHDLETLLRQTQGRGVNVYTHCEMLPAHAYPELKKYKHLVGNFGGAWFEQRKEFAQFPGAILMTTNCIQEPVSDYQGRIFTTGLVAWPGVTHVGNDDFEPVIQAALEADGFTQNGPEQTILVGFGHHAVLGVADKVIEAVKAGDLRHFFLIGGCDGARPGRNYYTEFAQAVPEDCAILTLACGKFRFNKLDFGDIGGIPRLLDVGQCNDAYSAIRIASALAEAFNCEVNDLPLSLVLSWYEQKAVCILLTLLYLGIRDIRIGPTLPAFVSPTVLDVLVKNFNIMPTTTVEDDLAACLGEEVEELDAA